VSLVPTDAAVRPVKGHDDLFAFRFDFVPEGKAVDGVESQVVTEQENGDLIIEGYAAVWEGDDRQGENFAPGAFTRGIKSFLSSQAALCFHHKHDQVLGKVLDLQEEGKGLKMKARVDGAIKNHPVLGTYYEQIKSGTLNGLSVGGFFKRALIEGKQKIADMDFTEISVTGVPMHTGPSFAVVAGKALVDDLSTSHVDIPSFPENEIRDEDFYLAQEALSYLDRIFDSLGKRGASKDEQSSNDAIAYSE
jgi:HK97 family phage prohead protease